MPTHSIREHSPLSCPITVQYHHHPPFPLFCLFSPLRRLLPWSGLEYPEGKANEEGTEQDELSSFSLLPAALPWIRCSHSFVSPAFCLDVCSVRSFSVKAETAAILVPSSLSLCVPLSLFVFLSLSLCSSFFLFLL